jgi:hypothetical protein
MQTACFLLPLTECSPPAIPIPLLASMAEVVLVAVGDPVWWGELSLRQVVGTWPICFPVGAPDFGHVLMDAAGGMAPRLDVWTSAFSRALVRAAVVALCARVWYLWRGRQTVRMRAPLVLRA